MSSKNRRKKSIVPPKVQIPLTIVLGIVFIFLLTARLRDRGTAGSAVPSAVGAEPSGAQTAKASSSQLRINSLIDKIAGDEQEGDADATLQETPEPPSDPFVEPDGRGALNKLGRLSREFRSQQRGGEDSGGENERRSREEFIRSLTLEGTLRDGNVGIAVISGKLYAEDDNVGRFKLVRVGERIAFLADDAGNVRLKMKGDDER